MSDRCLKMASPDWLSHSRVAERKCYVRIDENNLSLGILSFAVVIVLKSVNRTIGNWEISTVKILKQKKIITFAKTYLS